MVCIHATIAALERDSSNCCSGSRNSGRCAPLCALGLELSTAAASGAGQLLAGASCTTRMRERVAMLMPATAGTWRLCACACMQIVIGGRDKYLINGKVVQQG